MLYSMKCDENWIDKWLHPLLDTIGNHPQGSSFESSLVEILKMQPRLISNLEKWYSVGVNDSSRLKVYITVILACKKLGLLSTTCKDDTVLWKNMVKISALERALEHNDSKVFF